MPAEEHPISVLCDAHTIPMLMFLRENGPSCKTDIYASVGRSANMPLKIARLEGSGLVRVDEVGISDVVGLTELGESVAERLGEIDSLMLEQRP